MKSERTFIDWFLETAIPKNKNRIFLEADGGFGKSTQLSVLCKHLLKSENFDKFDIVPIYIDCKDLTSADTVEKFIVREFCGKDALSNVDKIYDVLKDSRYKYLLIFDGLNEVDEIIVNKIVNDFLDSVIGNNKEYNNVFIIVASRGESIKQEKNLIEILKYKKIILKQLDIIKVKKIVEADIKYPKKELIYVLTNPMALSLYIKTDKKIIYKDSKTLTDILDKYFSNEIETVSKWRKYTNDEKVLFEFTLNVFLPMLLGIEKFIYNKSDIKEKLNIIYDYIDNNYEFEFKTYIEENNYDLVILKYNKNFNYINAFNFLINDLKVFYKDGLNLKIHQVYIDYFCAIRFDKLIEVWIKFPQSFPLWCFGTYISIGPHKVINLPRHSKISFRERSYENLLEVLNTCRNNHCNYEQDILALSTSILASKNNSLAGIDFSNLDLRKCNFNNICLGKNNGGSPAILKNVRVTINNFVNNIFATCVNSDYDIKIISYSDERLVICDYTISFIYIINVIYNSVTILSNCITYDNSVIDDEVVVLYSKDGKTIMYVYKFSSHKFEKITDISENFAENVEGLSIINIQNQKKYVFTYIDCNFNEKNIIYNKDGSILASGKLNINVKTENKLLFSRIKGKNKYLILQQNSEEKQLCILGNSEYGINQFAYTNKKVVALCQHHKSFLIREFDYKGNIVNEIIPSTSVLKKSWYLEDKSMIIYYNFDGSLITFKPNINKSSYSYYNSYHGIDTSYNNITFCNCSNGIYMLCSKDNYILVTKYDDNDAYFKSQPYSKIYLSDIETQYEKNENSKIKILSVNKILSNIDTNEKLNRPGFIGCFNCIDENNNEIVICKSFHLYNNSWFNSDDEFLKRGKIYKIGLAYFDPIIYGEDCTRLRLTEYKDCQSVFENVGNEVNERIKRDIITGNFDVFLFMSGCDDRRYKMCSEEIKKEPEEIFLYSCYSARCSVIVFTSPKFRRYDNILLSTLVVYDYDGISATINNDASKEEENIFKELFYLNKVRRYPYRCWTAKLHGCIVSSIDLSENDKKILRELGYATTE